MKLGAAVPDVNRRVPALTACGPVLAFLAEATSMPSILVTLPAPLHRAAGGVGELVAEGETLALALAALRASRPAVTRLFLEEGNAPRRGVSLFLNGRDVRTLEGLDTPLQPGDRLSVVLLMAGG